MGKLLSVKMWCQKSVILTQTVFRVRGAFIGDMNMLLFGVAAKTMDELLAIFEVTGFKLAQFIPTPDVMTQILVVEKVR